MKVILLQDIARIGRRFEVKDVPSGHALNFLIPKKLAEAATPQSLKKLAERTQKSALDTEAANAAFQNSLKKLESEPVEMQVEANEKGVLFKGVSVEDIASQLKTDGHAVSKEQVVLDAPIKEVGDHIIELASGDQKGSFTLTIRAK